MSRALLIVGAAAAMLLSTATHAVSADANGSGRALLQALVMSDTVEAARLIVAHAPVNARDDTGATPLMFAAQLGDAALCEQLLAADADPNLKTSDGLTALQLAIANRAGAIALSLIGHGARTNVARANGETALMTAARTGQLDVMQALLKGGAPVNAYEKKFKQTALMWSAGHPAQVALLLAHGAKVQARTRSWKITKTIYLPGTTKIVAGEVTGDPWTHEGEYSSEEGGESALFFAVRKDDAESMRLLLDAGADVNETAADGATPLLRALYKWDASTIGRDSVANRDYYQQIYRPNLPLANLLLNRGARASVADVTGYTPLHGAVLSVLPRGRAEFLERARREGKEGSIEIAPPVADLQAGLVLIERLLALGADPNAATRFPTGGPLLSVRINPVPPGSSVLHLAAVSNNLPLMRMLLARGGNPNLLRRDGHSPFSAAVQTNDLPMVKLLAAHGADLRMSYDPREFIADPDHPTADPMRGQTALHIAALAGADEVIPFLVRHGVPLELKNAQGKSALQLADEQERFRYACALYHAKQRTIDRQDRYQKPIKAPVRETQTSTTLRQLLAVTAAN